MERKIYRQFLKKKRTLALKCNNSTHSFVFYLNIFHSKYKLVVVDFKLERHRSSSSLKLYVNKKRMN